MATLARALKRSSLLASRGQDAQAVREIQRVVEQAAPGDADSARAQVELAVLLARSNRLDEAAMHARRAVHGEPGDAYGHEVLSAVLRKQDRLTEAVHASRRAVTCEPNRAQAHDALAVCLQESGRLDEALFHIQRATMLEPGKASRYVNGSIIKLRMGDPSGGLEDLRNAKARGLQSDGLLWNEALLRLAQGDLERGWDLYEHGFAAGERTPEREFSLPRWQGESLAGKTLLVWREQGIGDEVRFLSCLPEVIARAGRVILETQERLVPLLQRSFPEAEVRVQAPERSAADDNAGLGEPDVHAPAGDLPRYLRRRPGAFPDHTGYLDVDATRRADFGARLEALGPGPRIGVAWRSRNLKTARLANYFTLDELAPILRLPGVTLVNLQYGPRQMLEDEIAAFESETGLRIHRWSDLDYTDDLDAVAALTSSLDVVVAPGSFPADLAGALGVPTYRLSGPVHPQSYARLWNPTVRIRSRRHDEGWARVVEEVRNEIGERFLSREGGRGHG